MTSGECAQRIRDVFIFESLPGAGLARHPGWRHLARSGSVTPTPRKYKPTGDRPGCRNGVEKKSGSIFAGVVRSFCGRAFTSGPGILSLIRNGLEATINSRGSGARGTTRRCEVWPSNGLAPFFGAGKIGSLMTRADIWPRSPNETHARCGRCWDNPVNSLWVLSNQAALQANQRTIKGNQISE